MQRQRIITPRVFKLMATVGAKPHFDSQLLRRLSKPASLITKLARQYQHAFWACPVGASCVICVHQCSRVRSEL